MVDWAEVFKHILKFLPRFEIIQPDEGGLFIRCGKLKKVLGKGVYFCMPYFDEITRYTTSVFTSDTTNQSLTTKDKKDILISWSCTYLVADGELAFLTVDDVDHQVAVSISGRITDYAGKKDYSEMKPNLLVNYIMRNEFIEEIAKSWGISIIGFNLHDLVLHKTFRLMDRKDS